MSAPAPLPPAEDQSISADDLVRELSAQLGMAAVEMTKLRLLLTRKDEEVRYLRSLQPASTPEG